MDEEIKQNEVETTAETAAEATTDTKKKKKKKKAIIIIAAVLVFILVSNTIATKIIYDNIFKRYNKPVYDELITDAWQAMIDARSEFTVDSSKGKIAACMYAAEAPSNDDGTPVLGAKENGLVVIAPGLHSGMDNYVGMASWFTAEGYDVVCFDPIGTRESEGKSCIGYSQEVYDLDAVLDYAEELKDYEKVYVVGHSRGATAACAMLDTSNKDISDHEIIGVISVSGFNSAMDAVIGLSSSYIGPVANINYPTLWAYQLTLFDYSTLQIQADQILNNTDTPVLILQGAKDDSAKVNKYSIYNKKDSITSANKEAYLSENCGHTDILYDDNGVWNDDTWTVIEAWMDKN